MENWYRVQAALLAAIICAALVVNVLLRGRRNIPFRRYAWLGANLVALFIVDALDAAEGLRGGVHIIAMRGLALSALPTTSIAFFSAFVADENRPAPWGTGLAFTLSVLLGLTFLALWVAGDAFPSPAAQLAAMRAAEGAAGGGIATALLASVAFLYRRFRVVEVRIERVRALYLTVATGGVFSMAFLSRLSGIGEAFFSHMLPSIYMFFMFQVITLRRILDLFEFLGRFVVLAGFAVVLSLIFALLVGWWRYDFGLFLFNTVIATIVILILFDPLRAFVEEKLNELIFREKYEFTRHAEAIRNSLANVIDVGAMADLMLSRLEAGRQVTHASIYLRDEEGLAFARLGSVGTAPTPSLDAIVARPFLTRLAAHRVLLIEALEAEATELAERATVEDQQQLEVLDVIHKTMLELEAAVAIAFESDAQLLGFLCVKNERLREAYSTDEIKALVALAAQATITIENSRLFERIRERDRLAAIGEMAAGLAHEIRNPLGAIKGAAQLVTEMEEEHKETYLNIIVDEVNRLDTVVSQFLTYARPLKGKGDLIDVNHVLERTLTLIRSDQHESEVELVTAPNLPQLRSDPELLRQVILNLSRNAIEAMAPQGGGKLTITTALTWRKPDAAPRGATSDSLAFVRIRVEDEGPGIPPEVMERLFIPFYTTKTQGTGLGLAICQRIVKNQGGSIEVTSKVGKGTTFTILLPVSEPSTRTTTAS